MAGWDELRLAGAASWPGSPRNSAPPHPHCTTSQALIGNYAVPILEDKPVWGTDDETRTAYMDTQDVARLTLAALRCGGCRGGRRTGGVPLGDLPIGLPWRRQSLLP